MSQNKTVNNATFKNDLQVNASKIKQVLWYFTNIFFIKNSLNINSGLKRNILKLFGAKVGRHVVIKPCVNIKYPWKLTIGDNTWIGENVWIDNLAQINIGDNVCLSQGALLLTGNHNFKKTTFDLITSAINLEDGVWIGAKAIVCPGVTCKTHAILSVGSIANKDMEPYSIYKGNPAIKIGERIIT